MIDLSLARPQALWLLLAVPVLLFLHMLRARRQPLVVSSTLLWQAAARDLQTRLPIRRLERSLLLLLQILATALLALALARPAVTVPGTGAPALVLVLDTTLSMQTREGPSSRFAEAQARALGLLARHGGRPAMLVESAAAPRAVAGFTRDHRALGTAIRALTPTDGTGDLEAAVRLALAHGAEGNAQVAVFSDRRGPALRRVVYVTVGSAAPDVALTRVAVRAVGDGGGLVLTEVRNGGPARTVVLRAAWPDGSEEAIRVALPAGGTATRTWRARGDGVARFVVDAGDALAADDAAAVVVGRAALPRVLLVTAGNPYLETVLSVLPTREVRMAPRADAAAFAGFDLVVLDRTAPQPLPPGRYLLVGTTAQNLPGRVDGTAANVVVRWTASAHPVLSMVDLTGVTAAEAQRLRLRGGTVLAEGEIPLLWAVDQGGLRALVLPFDLERSDLPLQPTFPLLMANAVGWLAAPITVPAGSVPLLPAGADARAELVDPMGRTVPLEARAGIFNVPRLDRAGVWRLRTPSATRLLAVQTAAAQELDDVMHPGTRGAPGGSGPPRMTDPAGLRTIDLWKVALALAAVVLMAEAVLWARSLPRRRRGPRALVFLRAAVLAALLVALTGLHVPRAGRDLAVVFALDFSDSVAAAARDRGVDLMRAAAARARPGDRFGLVAFGAEPLVAEGLTATPRFAVGARPPAHRTDIGAAVRAGQQLLPPHGGRRIVVLTDGRDTAGDAAGALALAAADGVEVGVLPLGGAPLGEAWIDRVQVPPTVRVGERFEVAVWVESTVEAKGSVRLHAGGRQVASAPVALSGGRTLVRLSQRARSTGVLTLEARLDVRPDGLAANNVAHAATQVAGPPTVWYVTRQSGPLVRWLSAQDVVVRPLPPEALPTDAAALAGTAAVILEDVPAAALSPAQRRALRDYVEALGGGLLVVGGPQAFGPGGYGGTDLEAALPVTMDVRHRIALPSMAVILVLDSSGSMGSFGTELAKVELAKEAAQSVVDLLGERDHIGVLAFDQEPRWLVRPTEARHREEILQQVPRLTAGGGTNLYPALVEAFRAVDRTPARIKHVIVLSDGQTDPGDFERIVRRMAERKITLSSVAIGSDADREIMRNLASWGGGRYYFTRDLYTIPQIFTAEAVLATRAYLIEERFAPVPAPGSPLLAGFAPPALLGYVATAPKPAATVHLASPQEDPLLATWQVGLGRAAAFTSDARGRWAAEWLAWPDAAAFWSRLARWVMAEAPSVLDVRATPEAGELRLLVDARDADGRPLTDLAVRARVVASGAEEIDLTQAAPGRYEGAVPALQPGAYVVTAQARRGAEVIATGRTTVAVPVSPELRAAGTDGGAIARLVEVPGVRAVGTVADVLAPAAGSTRRVPAWPALATAAFGLFLAEITWRRLPVLGEWAARGAAAATAWFRRRDLRPPPPEDQEYDAADRWRVTPSEEEERPSAGMEQAARLYIARLRQQQGGPGDHPHG